MIIRKKVNTDGLYEIAKPLGGYINIVVDIRREILAGGSYRHEEDLRKLISDGSLEEDVWGGGFYLESTKIDYYSPINHRPHLNNPSREIILSEVRYKFDRVVNYYLS